MLLLDAYEFVWGSGSKSYSEEVVRSYICKHGTIVKERRGQQLGRVNIAAIHKGGSDNNTDPENRGFGVLVNRMYRQGKYNHNIYLFSCPPPTSIFSHCIKSYHGS